MGPFPGAFEALLSETLVSRVAVWKQLLYIIFSQRFSLITGGKINLILTYRSVLTI
jgi:hypothetical protein